MEKQRQNVDSSNITITVIARSADNVCSNVELEALDVDVTWWPDLKFMCAEIMWATALALLLEFYQFMYAHLNYPWLLLCETLLYIVALNVTGCCMTGCCNHSQDQGKEFQSMTAAFLCWVSIFISFIAFALLVGGPDFTNHLPHVVRFLYPLPFVLVICAIVFDFILIGRTRS